MRIIFLVGFFTIAVSGITSARQDRQQGMRGMQFNADSVFMLNEVGGVISQEMGSLKVMMVGPAERRTKGSEGADLQRGDEIVMVSGKRLKTIKEIQEAYAATAIGSELKLGVRRGEEKSIVTILKADPSSFPQRRMMMAGGLPDGGEFLPALGLMIRNGKDSVVVFRVAPTGVEEVRKGTQVGDRITKLNGEGVKDVKSFVEAWDALKVGDNVDLTVQRAGKDQTIRFKKPVPQGGPVIIRQ